MVCIALYHMFLVCWTASKPIGYTPFTLDWRPYCDLNTHCLENADCRIKIDNDFSLKYPNFSHPSHRGLQVFIAFQVHGVFIATTLRSWGVFDDSTATMAFARRLHCDHTFIKRCSSGQFHSRVDSSRCEDVFFCPKAT